MEYLILLYLIGYPLAQYRAIRTMRGGWRAVAVVPAVITGVVVAFTAVAFAMRSNLWPLLLIFTAPLMTLYLLVLWLTYGLVRWVRA
jgi:hypothetical protein